MEYDQLINLIINEKIIEIGIIECILFLFWILISQIIFLFPLILIILVLTI